MDDKTYIYISLRLSWFKELNCLFNREKPSLFTLFPFWNTKDLPKRLVSDYYHIAGQPKECQPTERTGYPFLSSLWVLNKDRSLRCWALYCSCKYSNGHGCIGHSALAKAPWKRSSTAVDALLETSQWARCHKVPAVGQPRLTGYSALLLRCAWWAWGTGFCGRIRRTFWMSWAFPRRTEWGCWWIGA